MADLTALAYAIDRPERVRRLVLIGTGSGGPAYMRAPGALWNRTHPHFPGLAALDILHLLWRARGPERVMMNYIERYSFHDRRLVEPRKVSLLDWVHLREGRTDWHGIANVLGGGWCVPRPDQRRGAVVAAQVRWVVRLAPSGHAESVVVE